MKESQRLKVISLSFVISLLVLLSFLFSFLCICGVQLAYDWLFRAIMSELQLSFFDAIHSHSRHIAPP